MEKVTEQMVKKWAILGVAPTFKVDDADGRMEQCLYSLYKDKLFYMKEGGTQVHASKFTLEYMLSEFDLVVVSEGTPWDE